MKKTITLLLLLLSMLMASCFPAGALAQEASEKEIPASFDLRSVDTDGDGVGDHCYVTTVKLQHLQQCHSAWRGAISAFAS